MNLVLCLLSTRRFLTADQIARIVPGYQHDEDDPAAHEAFQRMFERDKAELRELGVPVETGTTSAFDTELGYRIAPRDYALPDIHLAPDEAAAVGLAARLWRQAGLASAASSGLLKLRAAGIEVDPMSTLGIEPVIAGEPAVDTMLTAVRSHRAVAFDYRGSHDDVPARRNLQPWGVVSWRGRWYVAGLDTDREKRRCFRLSRVVGAVKLVGRDGAYTPPADIDLRAVVSSFEGGFDYSYEAVVLIRPDSAHGLRRFAEKPGSDALTVDSGVADSGVTGPGVTGPGDQDERLQDWDLRVVRYAHPDGLAARLVGYGPDVVVVSPPEVRDAVVARLRDLAGSTKSDLAGSTGESDLAESAKSDLAGSPSVSDLAGEPV